MDNLNVSSQTVPPQFNPNKKLSGLALGSFICGLFFIIPFLGMVTGLVAIILGIVALVMISKRPNELKGNGFAIAGIVMGGIGIILIPIFALIAAIAIPNFLRAKITANDAYAKATLKVLSTAAEAYSAQHAGNYPLNISALTAANPPYLNSDPCFKTDYGFFIDCQTMSNGYVFTAKPVTEGVSGSAVFTVSTGGVMGESAVTQEQTDSYSQGDSFVDSSPALDQDHDVMDATIKNLSNAKIEANDANAKATLKSLATAVEAFNAVTGQYPVLMSDLTGAEPPYLNSDPCQQTAYGFTIDCQLRSDGYTFAAKPVDSSAGSATFAVTTDGIFYVNGVRQN